MPRFWASSGDESDGPEAEVGRICASAPDDSQGLLTRFLTLPFRRVRPFCVWGASARRDLRRVVLAVAPPAVRLPRHFIPPLGALTCETDVSQQGDTVRAMNPNRHRAVEIRRRALVDQVQGLLHRAASGRAERHIDRRLRDTRAELAELEAASVSALRRRARE